MKVDGRCHCGSITYEAEIDPDSVFVCHCTDCQTLSGSAFRVVVPASTGDLRLLSGKLKTYLKTAESGNKRANTFCPDCGTPVYSSAADGGPLLYIRVGTMRQRSALSPSRQIWFRSAQPWLTKLGALPKVEKDQ